MMYLVLTAMLALNVSKEVLDSFAIMDAELVRSERAHEQRSQLEYAVFEEAAHRFPDKFGAKHDQARRVKAMADDLVEQVQGIKTRAMDRAGWSPTSHAVKRRGTLLSHCPMAEPAVWAPWFSV